MLVVDGEPGVGKTRLGWEFEKYVDGFEASVLWHRGRCLSYGEGVAYYALAEAVRGRLAVLADAVDAERGGRGQPAAAPAGPGRLRTRPGRAGLARAPARGAARTRRRAAFPREDLFVAWTAFFKYVGLWQGR